MLSVRNRNEIVRRLRLDPLFASLDDVTCLALIKRSEITHLAAGELLYAAGEPARHVFVIVEGALQIEYPERGKSRGYVASMLAAPAFLGECQVLHARSWSGTGVALSPLVALAFDRSVLEELILAHSEVGLALYREITLRFLGAIETWKNQPTLEPRGLLARYLVSYLALRARTQTDTEAPIGLTQADLGRATGLRRETVNRVLKAWTKQKIVVVGPRGITRADLEGIQRELPADHPLLLAQNSAL